MTIRGAAGMNGNFSNGNQFRGHRLHSLPNGVGEECRRQDAQRSDKPTFP